MSEKFARIIPDSVAAFPWNFQNKDDFSIISPDSFRAFHFYQDPSGLFRRLSLYNQISPPKEPIKIREYTKVFVLEEMIENGISKIKFRMNTLKSQSDKTLGQVSYRQEDGGIKTSDHYINSFNTRYKLQLTELRQDLECEKTLPSVLDVRKTAIIFVRQLEKRDFSKPLLIPS